MSAAITRSEWLKAFEAASAVPPQDPRLKTLSELCELFGVGKAATLRKISMMIKKGLAQRGKKRIVMQNGRSKTVGAYRLVKTKVS